MIVESVLYRVELGLTHCPPVARISRQRSKQRDQSQRPEMLKKAEVQGVGVAVGGVAPEEGARVAIGDAPREAPQLLRQ